MNKKTGQGLFITFEGPEGAGKTTQIKRLRHELEGKGREVIVTREPGGTEVAEQLRDIVKHHVGEEPITDEAELLLFAASRAQHVRNLIAPSTEKGIIVLCDRFIDSTTAYQGYGRQQDLDFISKLNQYAIHGFIPHLTILLDITPEKGFERTVLRQQKLFEDVEDRIEGETIEFHRRVRSGYLKIAEQEPERVRIVSADQEETIIQKEIWEVVDHAFGPF